MKNYIKAHEWQIIEETFDPHVNKISESIFSLGNGKMGQRANFEEHYSGETLQGNYVAGVYYPDKTRVGWWKNGYPDYFAKVLNAANWIGLSIQVDGEELDLAKVTVSDFSRVLNMKEGYLKRQFKATFSNGKQIEVSALRFCSIAEDEIAALQYTVKALNFDGTLSVCSFVDGDIKNQDSNYDEKFWDFVSDEVSENSTFLTLRTKKTGFEVCTGTHLSVSKNGENLVPVYQISKKEKYIGLQFSIPLLSQEELGLVKIAANLSSENYPKDRLLTAAKEGLARAAEKGFSTLLAEQERAWAVKWEESDIVIKGDVAAQQAIRFNIFQLFQTYTGKDSRLNIGPKGFTGEKYGGSTYWDTEAYCVPFYLATAPQEVSRNLLIYRYHHLGKAIENAEKLGFSNGAALFPMVTMNGEECHNEWEITFEEIHRNGAIAYAIYNYVRYTGDEAYLEQYGLEVLIGIARFWKQRVNWSGDKQKYVILGVTGPNEYENNINNNWYTNYLAVWCLKYAQEASRRVAENNPERYRSLVNQLQLKGSELEEWQSIVEQMYYPYDEKLGVFLQQEGYLDKEQVLVQDLAPTERPLNQKWSWDRILRSCFIKQADVLQGLYFFEDDFDYDTHKRNFDFYEPRTVHESSLSPCVHSILAAKLNDGVRAYEFYLRTSRLDLDDYNNDTEDGLHITSMAGTWMSVVEGFAGMRVRDDKLMFTPFLPDKWESFAFTVGFRGTTIKVHINASEMIIVNGGEQSVLLAVHGQDYQLQGKEELKVINSLLV